MDRSSPRESRTPIQRSFVKSSEQLTIIVRADFGLNAMRPRNFGRSGLAISATCERWSTKIVDTQFRHLALGCAKRMAPNPRLQRTRFALLRSPLSRKPLGGRE